MNSYRKYTGWVLPHPARAAIIVPLLVLVSVVTAVTGCGNDPASSVEAIVVAEGLTSPRGLTFDSEGNLLIAETGGGRVLKATPGGEVSLLSSNLPYALNTGPEAEYRAGPSAISVVDGQVFVLVGEFRGRNSARLYRIVDETRFDPITPVTDAFSPTSNRFSNPYDIVNAPEVGGWIVSDAGGNSVVRVDSDGNITDYMVFDNFAISGREMEVEMVPTGIARGPDGAVYVGTLTGYPYPQGQAIVWRMEDLNGDGDAMDDGEVKPHVTGLSVITDITFGSDGTLYIAEFSSDAKDVLEGGDIAEKAVANPGRVVKWDGSELAEITDNVVSPTGLAVAGPTLYISEEYAGRVSKIALD